MNPLVEMFLFFCMVVLTYATNSADKDQEIVRVGDEFVYNVGNIQQRCKIDEMLQTGDQELPCQCGACLMAGGCSGEGSCLIDGICDMNWEKYHGDQQKCLNDGGAPCDMCPQVYGPGQDEDFEDDIDENEEYSVGYKDGSTFSEPEETQDLNEEELALIYREVTNAFREEGLHEAAESTAREWEEIQSSADRRRLVLSASKMVGKRAACSGFNGSGKQERKCYNAFSNMVNKLIAHEGNLATSTCQKPADKLQRNYMGCCGSGFRVGVVCLWGADGPAAGCCGCTQAIDNYCYADHGSCPTIEGRDVCPPDKWTCARWKVIPFASWFKAGDICADTTANCAKEIATMGMYVLDIIANIILTCFTGPGGKVVKSAITSGGKLLLKAAKGKGRQILATAFKTAFTTAVKNGVKKAIWDNVKDNLKKHFKKMTKQLGNYLMEEMMAIASVQAAKEEAKGAKMAWDIAEIVDPTGFAAFGRYLMEGQEECKYPDGPTDQDMSALNAIFKESENWHKSCGGTPHGGTETRQRYRLSTVTSPMSCELQLETQKRTCHHGQITDWTGQRSSDGVLLSTKTSCRTATRHTRKMDCKQNCPSGWRHFSTTNHGCCESFWSCGGNMKWCEKYTHRQARNLPTAAVVKAPACRGGIGSGRCGPKFGHKLCGKGWPYCNEANGWCGNTNAHKNAQPSTTYDYVKACDKNFLDKSSGHESSATAQSMISNPAEFSMLHGFALVGLLFIMHSSYKLISKEQGYVDVPNKAEPQEI